MNSIAQTPTQSPQPQRNRALGALYGQFIGDSLGSLVEFQSAEQIRQRYPQGVRDLANGGTWGLLAGQPTDDSQMAMELLLALLEHQAFDATTTLANYHRWMRTEPFDIGNTISYALANAPGADSQSNGALMRISPLAILYSRSNFTLEQAIQAAREDAMLTHLNQTVLFANGSYVAGLVTGIHGGTIPQMLAAMEASAGTPEVAAALADGPSAYRAHDGWVLLSLSLAAQALRRAVDNSVEDVLSSVVGFGGDTDTHAAIAGALLGAACGIEAFPQRWVQTVRECGVDKQEVLRLERSRQLEERYWPTQLDSLVDKLLGLGG